MKMLAELTGMQLYCMQIARLAEDDDLAPTIAGLAKMNNTRKARSILAEARDMLGGNGILLDDLSFGAGGHRVDPHLRGHVRR